MSEPGHLRIGEIANHRNPGDISGTLSAELWALSRPYTGGQFAGIALAGTRVGEIFGLHFLSDLRYELDFQEPPTGTWHLSLMLREWTDAGYVTRDYVSFAQPYVVGNKPAISRNETDNVINVDFAPNKKFTVPNSDTAAGSPGMATTPGKQDLVQETAVSINTASLEQIAAVKGLSKKVAENLVTARPFTRIDDLLHVKGMGPKLLEKVRNFIRL